MRRPSRKGRAAAPAVRVSQIESVRRIVEEELESVWANRKPAKEALDNAVQRVRRKAAQHIFSGDISKR